MQQYPIEDGQIRFLFIGRVMREKGVDELFCSMEQLHEKYPNIMLDVVGWCEEDYETRLQKLQEKGLVTFHGFQRDVKPFIRKAHVFVLPSYHEGMANEEKWQMEKNRMRMLHSILIRERLCRRRLKYCITLEMGAANGSTFLCI